MVVVSWASPAVSRVTGGSLRFAAPPILRSTPPASRVMMDKTRVRRTARRAALRPPVRPVVDRRMGILLVWRGHAGARRVIRRSCQGVEGRPRNSCFLILNDGGGREFVAEIGDEF